MNYPHAGYMQQIPYVWWSCRQIVKIRHAFLCRSVKRPSCHSGGAKQNGTCYKCSMYIKLCEYSKSIIGGEQKSPT